MMGAGIAHAAYCPVDLGGSMEQGLVHIPEFPGDGEMRVPSGQIPGQPCSEPWLETDGMFIHSETAETAQAQRKLWGVFFPFLFHNLFPEALFVFNSLRLYVAFAAQL